MKMLKNIWNYIEGSKIGVLVFLVCLVIFLPDGATKNNPKPLPVDSAQYYHQRTIENWQLMQIRLKKQMNNE